MISIFWGWGWGWGWCGGWGWNCNNPEVTPKGPRNGRLLKAGRGSLSAHPLCLCVCAW